MSALLRTWVVGSTVLLTIAAVPAHAVVVVVPAALAATEGDSSHSLPMNTGSRLQEIVYDDAVLATAGLTPGATIVGLRFRVNGGGAASPAISFSDWTVKLGASALSAASAVPTFASNVLGGSAGLQTVRTGALSLGAGYFPGAATPNAFAAPITFDTPFTYTGTGHGLVIEMTHSAGSAAIFVDSFNRGTVAGIASFNADAVGALAETATNRVSGTTTVLAFDVLPAVPEPAAAWLLAGGGLGLWAMRRRRAP